MYHAWIGSHWFAIHLQNGFNQTVKKRQKLYLQSKLHSDFVLFVGLFVCIRLIREKHFRRSTRAIKRLSRTEDGFTNGCQMAVIPHLSQPSLPLLRGERVRKWQSNGSQMAVKWQSDGSEMEIKWQSDGSQTPSKSTVASPEGRMGSQMAVRWQSNPI